MKPWSGMKSRVSTRGKSPARRNTGKPEAYRGAGSRGKRR